MTTRKFSDIQLADVYDGIPKGRVFEISNKVYKILGFDIRPNEVNVVAVRLLKATYRPSPKQPLCEFFKYEDTLQQIIKIPNL